MAWRITKQPNEKYARFTDAIDDFSHYDMNRNEAIALCREMGSSLTGAEEELRQADTDPARFAAVIKRMTKRYGVEVSKARAKQLSYTMADKRRSQNTDRPCVAHAQHDH